METVASSLIPPAASFAIGVALRRSLCTEVDAITAKKLATHVTLPCLVLSTFNPASVSLIDTVLPAVLYGVATLVPGILAWATTRQFHPKERGVLAGVSVGSAMELFAIPLVSCLFAYDAMHAVLICCFLNILFTKALSALYYSTAGPAFPKNFPHTDGGVYNGEWKGALKDGFGVYAYPSGAKYEGEWLDGSKEGRGVYTFAKGGIYEGEWRNGKMEGVGVRTFSTGKVSSGLWKEGKLVKSIDESQCALVVANANEAATVARRVFVGAIGWDGILRSVLTQTVFWSFIIATGLSFNLFRLSPTLEYVASEISKAHSPLAMLSLGLMLEIEPVEARQMAQVTKSLATRLIPGMLLYSLACTALVAPGLLSIGAICAMALATVSPLPSYSLHLAHLFRLNENLVASVARYSMNVSFVLATILIGGTVQAIAMGTSKPLLSCLLVCAAACWILMAFWSPDHRNRASSDQKVRMVYTGPVQTQDPKTALDTEEPGQQPGAISTDPNADDTREGSASAIPSNRKRPWSAERLSCSKWLLHRQCGSRPLFKSIRLGLHRPMKMTMGPYLLRYRTPV